MRAVGVLVLIVVGQIVAGCGSKPPAASNPPNAGPSAPPPPVVAGQAPAPSMNAAPSGVPAAPTSVAEIPGAKKAEVGLGKKGHYGGDGILATPISVRFRAEEALMLASIEKAMQLYKATEGHAPKSHEEFMEKIIRFNAIRLPELPPGEAYRYDPETAELMVIPAPGK